MNKKELRNFVFKEMKGIMAGSRLAQRARTTPPAEWTLSSLAGRLVEIQSAPNTAALTHATRLILQAQQNNEPVAWIAPANTTFFPPDLAQAGVDLESLPVIQAPDPLKAAGIADTLIRSDGFGLVILDISRQSKLPASTQTRLAGLARQHQTALICLSAPQQPLHASSVSLRLRVEKDKTGFNQFTCKVHVTKDKQRNQGWDQTEVCRGPNGLC